MYSELRQESIQALEIQVVQPRGLMNDNDQPEHQLEREFTRLVTQCLLSDQRTRPATQQLNQMQAGLGRTPAATQCAALVVQVEPKANRLPKR